MKDVFDEIWSGLPFGLKVFLFVFPLAICALMLLSYIAGTRYTTYSPPEVIAAGGIDEDANHVPANSARDRPHFSHEKHAG